MPRIDHRLNVALNLGVSDTVGFIERNIIDGSSAGSASADLVTGVCQHIHVGALDDRRHELIELAGLGLKRRCVLPV